MTTDAELRERITRLEDRAEIREAMMRYARGMDRRDRELLRSAYHDGAVDDHVGFVGEKSDPSYDRPLASSRSDARTSARSPIRASPQFERRVGTI